MASWLWKAAAQGTVSLAPGPVREKLNLALQRRVTKSVVLSDDGFTAKLGRVPSHLAHYARAADGGVPSAAFELGTGWYPVVPVGLALAGVERVVTFDIRSLADAARINTVLEAFARAHDIGRLTALLPQVADSRLERLLAWRDDAASPDPKAVLGDLGVELAVGDARATGMPPDSFDLIVSNNTFEHIPEESLRAILREFARITVPGGVTDHFIDMRDHYAGFDPSLGRLNYLRYSDPVWRLFNNRLQFQNRLRLTQYRDLVESAGFRIAGEEIEWGKNGEFDGLKLARRFRELPQPEVFALYVWLTGRLSSD